MRRTGWILGLALAAAILLRPATVDSKGADTYISGTAQEACTEIGESYGICPELLEAIIERESHGNPNAESGGCKGLMQVYQKFHVERMARLGVTDIYDERGNILVGTDYLAELFGEYGEACLVLDVFHGDSKAMSNYESGIMSGYAEWILERSAELERAHGK